MCRLLEVSANGYEARQGRPTCRRALRDVSLTAKIHAIHRLSQESHGVSRIHAELTLEHGIHIGRKRVVRLMRTPGLRGVWRRRFMRTTTADRQAVLPPDLVERNFHILEPDGLWVADITCIPTWLGFLYLAIVLDVCSRKVVDWTIQNNLRTELELAVINMALAQRRPQWIIHHSDHGCQYTSFALGKRCREMGVTPSVGSVGDAYHNAMGANFFASLECELLDRRCFHTHTEAKLAIFEWLGGWYNPHRRHSSLGYLSPVQFECELRAGRIDPEALLPLNAPGGATIKSAKIGKEEKIIPALQHRESLYPSTEGG